MEKRGGERMLTAREFARRKRVHVRTVRGWVADGLVRAEFTAGGHIRIPESELEKVNQAARARRERRYGDPLGEN